MENDYWSGPSFFGIPFTKTELAPKGTFFILPPGGETFETLPGETDKEMMSRYVREKRVSIIVGIGE